VAARMPCCRQLNLLNNQPVFASGFAFLLAASALHTRRALRGFRATTHTHVACDTVDTLGASCDNSWIRDLVQDPEGEQNSPNRTPREVRSGHYVLVEPMPLPDPFLVAYTPSMVAALGLSEEQCSTDGFARLFSGDLTGFEGFQSWATPYALSIYGNEVTNNCPFGTGNGYGDGRALSIGEVVSGNGERWELQLKGAGRTPFARGADGRAVLRSSVREFLVSEAMHHLGVETTRAVSLVASGTESAMRPWYSGSSMSDETNLESILKRLLKDQRGLELEELPDGVRAQLREQLRVQFEQQRGSRDPNMMQQESVAIACRAAKSFVRVGHLELFARRARGGDPQRLRELELIVEHALNREFSDVEPGKPLQVRAVAMLRTVGKRLARLVGDWVRIGYVQGNFNSDNCLVGGRTMDYGPFGFIERYGPLWNMWVGGDEKYGFLNQPQAALYNLKSLAQAVLPILNDAQHEDVSNILQEFSVEMSAVLSDVWRRKLGLPHAGEASQRLFSELEPMLRSKVDYTIFWRSLADVAALGSVDMGDEALFRPLHPGFYDTLSPDETGKLAAWVREWLTTIEGQCRTGAEAAAEMRGASPKYVPREWMLVAAYDAAYRGDYAPLHELQRLFRQPYAEQPEFHERFFRRASPEAESKGGIAWMS